MPGDHVEQLPGWVHTVANIGDEGLVYYVIANNADDEQYFCPDPNKWLSGNTIIRTRPADYFDGKN